MSGSDEAVLPTLGTKLSVFHRTAFIYASPATNSVNTLHLEPRTFPYQKTIGALIRVVPARYVPSWVPARWRTDTASSEGWR